MSEFMLTLFLGNIFVMAITILLIGFMFVLRVMLNLWFDTDFFKKIVAWFKNTDEKMKKKKINEEKEAKIPLIIDNEEFEDE